MHVFHGEVFTGGIFDIAGGVSRPRLARFLRSGGPWVARQPSVPTRCRDGVTMSCREAVGYENGIRFQWYRGFEPLANGPTGTGSVIVGATERTLAIQNAGNADEGTYRCLVSNSCGAENTVGVPVVICAGDRDCNNLTEPAEFERLMRLAVRAAAGSGRVTPQVVGA